MLIQESLPSFTQLLQVFERGRGAEKNLLDWMLGAEAWENSKNRPVHSLDSSWKVDAVLDVKETIAAADSAYSRILNCYSSSSATCSLSGSGKPSIVYQRRLKKKSASRHTVARSEGSENFECERAGKVLETVAAWAHPLPPPSNLDATPSDFESSDGGAKIPSVNESCSSSMSIMENASSAVKMETFDDAGECSSSGNLLESIGSGGDMSEKDLCISFLRYFGLIRRFRPKSPDPPSGSIGECHVSRRGISCQCKTCGLSDSAVNMLICDHCDEPYHLTCCNPCVRSVPIDEWLCHSCFKKKYKLLKEKASGEAINASNDLVIHKGAASRSDLTRLAVMLNGAEGYTTGVRIGKAFQADVPEWSGPVSREADGGLAFGFGKEEEDAAPFHHHHHHIPKLNSICNWLQCQAIVKGLADAVDGTVCGKWRRAPLFEIQTDRWDCFSSVSWDTSHADCAVPQEVDTDEVMRQLKYVEMLRPGLASKRRRTPNGGMIIIQHQQQHQQHQHT